MINYFLFIIVTWVYKLKSLTQQKIQDSHLRKNHSHLLESGVQIENNLQLIFIQGFK